METTLHTAADTDSHHRASPPRRIADLPGPKGHPYFGNALQISGRQLHLKLAALQRRFGPMFRLSVFGNPLVVVADPAIVAGLLRERPDGYRRIPGLKKLMGELNIGGVVTAEGEDWRKQRKLVMGGLNVEVIRNFFPTMVMMTERMRARWDQALAQGRAIDLQHDLKALALDIIVGLTLGCDLDAVRDDGHPLQHDVDSLFRRLGVRNAAPFPYWRHVKLPADRAADRSVAAIERTVLTFIEDARTRLAEQSAEQIRPANMLEAMILASEDPDSDFSDQDLVSNAILSVFGGEDTTANSMAWMLLMLAHNPAAAATLAAEVDAVLGDRSQVDQWEQMKRFPYLEAAHSETQRLRPVAPVVGLASNADGVIGDTFIPKNTAIILMTAGEAEHAAIFPDPAQFRPERWLFEHRPAKDDDPSRRLFPFGGGPRLCPGRFLALIEIKVVVSMIMRHFILEPIPGASAVKQVNNFFMGPSALPVRLRPR